MHINGSLRPSLPLPLPQSPANRNTLAQPRRSPVLRRLPSKTKTTPREAPSFDTLFPVLHPQMHAVFHVDDAIDELKNAVSAPGFPRSQSDIAQIKRQLNAVERHIKTEKPHLLASHRDANPVVSFLQSVFLAHKNERKTLVSWRRDLRIVAHAVNHAYSPMRTLPMHENP